MQRPPKIRGVKSTYEQQDQGSTTGTFDVEVRLGTGAALDSAEFELTAAVQA